MNAAAQPSEPGRDLEQLLAAAVGGSARAVGDLLSEIRPMVLRFCRVRLGRQETATVSAEDVTQEICLAVCAAIPTYELKGLSFRAFVFGIAHHKVADTFRALGRSRSEAVADLPDMPVTGDGPEQQILTAELAVAMDTLLHELGTRQREVLHLRLRVGLSADETAYVVRSTPGAVRVTQHRALLRLRELVKARRRP